MAPIPLPRRGVRTALIIGVLLWLGYSLLKRFTAVVELDEAGQAQLQRALLRGAKRTAAAPAAKTKANGFDPALALGEKQKKKVTAPVAAVAPPKAAAGKKGKKDALPAHKYLDNGLLVVNPKGQHPIYDLLEKGKEVWDGKLERASKTLGQAVDEYRRRYDRAPPKGFDRW